MPIYLMRHGETNWNKQRRIQGQKEIRLNEHGIIQVKEAFSQLLNGTKIHYIVSSPLQRAIDSANICAALAGLSVQIDRRFAERHFGELEGMTLEEIKSAYNIDDPESLDSSVFGLESKEAMNRRIWEGIFSLEGSDIHNVLVLTHGSVISSLTSQATIPRNGAIIELVDERIRGINRSSGIMN